MDRTHSLYRLFAADGSLLYIGITSDLGARWTSHNRTQPWWREVSAATLEHFDSRSAASDAEVVAIKAERPRHNRAHNGVGYSRVPTDVETRAAIERRLLQREWLTVAEVAALFSVPTKAAAQWLERGTRRMTGGPFFIESAEGADGKRRARPEDVARLLVETLKVRNGLHPEGIPGRISPPATGDLGPLLALAA